MGILGVLDEWALPALMSAITMNPAPLITKGVAKGAGELTGDSYVEEGINTVSSIASLDPKILAKRVAMKGLVKGVGAVDKEAGMAADIVTSKGKGSNMKDVLIPLLGMFGAGAISKATGGKFSSGMKEASQVIAGLSAYQGMKDAKKLNKQKAEENQMILDTKQREQDELKKREDPYTSLFWVGLSEEAQGFFKPLIEKRLDKGGTISGHDMQAITKEVQSNNELMAQAKPLLKQNRTEQITAMAKELQKLTPGSDEYKKKLKKYIDFREINKVKSEQEGVMAKNAQYINDIKLEIQGAKMKAAAGVTELPGEARENEIEKVIRIANTKPGKTHRLTISNNETNKTRNISVPSGQDYSPPEGWEIGALKTPDGYKQAQVLTKVVQQFNSSDMVKRGNKQIAFADTATAMMETDNPIAHESVTTMMARASGEVGNLAKHDKEPFGSDQAILSKLEQILTKWEKGVKTPENVKWIKGLADIFAKSGQRVKESKAREFSAQIANANKHFKWEAQDVMSSLMPDIPYAAGAGSDALNDIMKDIGVN